MAVIEGWEKSSPASQPAATPTISQEVTAVLVQGGQVFAQGLGKEGAKPVTTATPTSPGDDSNLASNDEPIPTALNKSNGNPTQPRPKATHASGGAIPAGLPPGFQPTRSRGR